MALHAEAPGRDSLVGRDLELAADSRGPQSDGGRPIRNTPGFRRSRCRQDCARPTRGSRRHTLDVAPEWSTAYSWSQSACRCCRSELHPVQPLVLVGRGHGRWMGWRPSTRPFAARCLDAGRGRLRTGGPADRRPPVGRPEHARRLDVPRCRADRSTLRLAGHRTQRVGARRASVHRWLADVLRLPRVGQLHLQALNRAGTEAQVASLLGTAPHQALVDDVFSHTLGNPYLNILLTEGLAPSARSLPADLPADLRVAVRRTWHSLFAAPPATSPAWLRSVGVPYDLSCCRTSRPTSAWLTRNLPAGSRRITNLDARGRRALLVSTSFASRGPRAVVDPEPETSLACGVPAARRGVAGYGSP